MEKQFKGKAIYTPSGRAAEYARWACNFYTGCSNACDYCYCRKGVMAHTWSIVPKLKKCFENEDHALAIFEKELVMNKAELQKHGLFFSFTTDPMLPETYDLTRLAISICYVHHIPISILTKTTWWVKDWYFPVDFAAIGFTLTGHDELELNASTNAERIDAMKILHDQGVKIFASIEPVIDTVQSISMIMQSKGYCDLYKIGLQSGKVYSRLDLLNMFTQVKNYIDVPVYWKDSYLEQLGSDRALLSGNCVGRDYNIFNSDSLTSSEAITKQPQMP